MYLSDSDVTLRNGNWGAYSERLGTAVPAQWNGGSAVGGRRHLVAGRAAKTSAPAATTFVNEARWYAQIARVAAIVGSM